MTSLVFLVGLAIVLFVLSYFTKRRFGVLGLSLAAGALLSMNWAGTLTPFIEQQGVSVTTPPLSTIVQILLILLPPMLLLFSGSTYNKTLPRVGGALAFTLLALAFLLSPLSTALRLEGTGLAVFKALADYQGAIVVIGLLGAVADVFFTRTPGSRRKGGH